MNHLRQWAIAAEAYAGADDELPREKPPGSPWQVSILNTWQVVSNPTNSDVWYNALAQEANDGRTMIYFQRDHRTSPGVLWPQPFHLPHFTAGRRCGGPAPAILPHDELETLPKRPGAGKNCTTDPSRTALFLDAGVPGETKLPNQSNYDGRPHAYANRFCARHDGRGNIAFFDSHVVSLRAVRVVTPDGLAFFPPQAPVQWTCDPQMDPN